MFCNQCGAELKEGVKFCPHCGVALDSEKTQVSDTAPVAPATEATVPTPIPAPPAAQPTMPVQPAAELADSKQAKKVARHRVLGGFPLFLMCLGFAQSIYLFVAGAVLVTFALILPPLYANEWMRFALFGTAVGYGLAGLFQLISAALLLRRGKRFIVL